MNLNDFHYTLPSELIAQYPSQKRDDARLMVIDRATGQIRHDIFRNIAAYVPSQSVIVLNNSKVIPARLIGKKERNGAEVEVFLLKRLTEDTYEALLRPLRKIKVDEKLIFSDNVTAQLVDKEKRIVKFNRTDMEAVLDEVGHMPLPPYIKRSDEKVDRSEYQTVYAKTPGSVASPTAGLHFTRPLLKELANLGCSLVEVTLHINYGTFQPVEIEDITQHPMHFEDYMMAEDDWGAVMRAKAAGQKIVAVGTTSCRVLESVAQSGQLSGSTNLFIYPGRSFNVIDHLITNFHLPFSTLLMLVYAFGGTDLMKRAYEEAVKERYRFYSYGDGMIIL